MRPPDADGRFTWLVPVRDAARTRAEQRGTAQQWSAAHREQLLRLAKTVWPDFRRSWASRSLIRSIRAGQRPAGRPEARIL